MSTFCVVNISDFFNLTNLKSFSNKTKAFNSIFHYSLSIILYSLILHVEKLLKIQFETCNTQRKIKWFFSEIFNRLSM